MSITFARRLAAFALAVLMCAATARQAGAMTLYTSEILPDVQALVTEFQKTHPGADIKIFRSGSGEVEAKLRAEQEAGNLQADALWVADPTFFEYMVSQKLMRRTDVRAPGYSPTYSYQNGTYHEVRLLYNIMGINTRKLGTTPPPKNWTDLLKPQYRNLVAMPDPNYSGGALATMGALTKRYGFGFFEKLKANGMKIERSNPLLVQKLGGGDYAIALMVDFTVRQEMKNGAPLAVIYPSDGSILVPTPIGVLAGAKDAATADAFVRFLATKEAQRIFAERAYVPIVASAAPPGAATAPARTLSSASSVILSDKDSLLRRFNTLFGLSQ